MSAYFSRVADVSSRQKLRLASSNSLTIPFFSVRTVGKQAFPVSSATYGTNCHLMSPEHRHCRSTESSEVFLVLSVIPGPSHLTFCYLTLISSVATGGHLPQPCWVMGFAQIRRDFFGGGDGGRTCQQTCIEKHLTAVNCLHISGFWGLGDFCPQAPCAQPDFRVWLRHWHLYWCRPGIISLLL